MWRCVFWWVSKRQHRWQTATINPKIEWLLLGIRAHAAKEIIICLFLITLWHRKNFSFHYRFKCFDGVEKEIQWKRMPLAMTITFCFRLSCRTSFALCFPPFEVLLCALSKSPFPLTLICCLATKVECCNNSPNIQTTFVRRTKVGFWLDLWQIDNYGLHAQGRRKYSPDGWSPCNNKYILMPLV